MQNLIIAGNVGKDAELRRTNGGDPVLNFSVAVDNGKDKQGNKRDSTWFDCSIWGKRAEALERHITKGTKLALSGRPTARAYNEKAYLGISVNELTFMGGQGQGGGSDRGPSTGYGYGGSGEDQISGGVGDLSDEIPF